jgi:O-antigen/teichoic acid export membrane protein
MPDRVPPRVLFEGTATVHAERTGGGLRKLFSNGLTMAFGNIITRGVGYFYVLLIARRLSTRDIGIYAVLLTASMILELAANLGLDKIIIREIVSGDEPHGRAVVRAALPMRLQIASVAAVLCWFILRAVYPDLFSVHGVSAAVFLCAVVPLAAARNCEAFLTAHETMFPIALSQMAERVTILSAALAVYFGKFTLDQFLYAFLISALARLIVVAWGCRRIGDRGVPVISQPLGPLLKEAAQLFSVELMALVYFRADTFMLSKMASLHDTGVYQIAYKMFDFTISLFTGFVLAAFPRLIRQTGHSDLRWMLPAGSALLLIPAGLIILLRRPLLGSFRAEYMEASTALVWLMLTVPLVYATSLMANSMIARGGVKLLMRFAIFLVAFNIGCNYVLIPRWSISGSAFATFASELFSASILLILICRRSPSAAEAPVVAPAVC